MKVIITVVAKHEPDAQERRELLADKPAKMSDAQHIAVKSLAIAKGLGIPESTTEIGVKVVEGGQVEAARFWHPEDDQ